MLFAENKFFEIYRFPSTPHHQTKKQSSIRIPPILDPPRVSDNLKRQRTNRVLKPAPHEQKNVDLRIKKEEEVSSSSFFSN